MKRKGAKVIVIAHWGVDFGKVQIKQRGTVKEAGRFNYWTRAYDVSRKIELLWCIVSAMEYSIVMENMINVLYLHIVLLRLTITPENDLSLKLYPIYTIIKKHFWQPRFN